MSTSLLYHGFGLKGIRYHRLSFSGASHLFYCQLNSEKFCCPLCGSKRLIRKGKVPRKLRCLPIGSKPVFIHLDIQRVLCLDCLTLRQVRLPFAEPKRRYTRSFARYALDLCRRMTIKDVADHLGVGWDMIKEIQKTYLQRRFARPRLRHLQQIAIDEIAIRKGHNYLTVVLDLESGAVVFVGDGRGSDALTPFWRRVRASGAKIEAVAIDMSPAYIKAVKANLPKAAIVFDRFHIMKMINSKISDLRRELYAEATDKLQKKVLKGSRWLLLKRPETLDHEREYQRLNEVLKLNTPLTIAYIMREELRQFWEQDNLEKARKLLLSWCERATESGIKILRQMAKTLLENRMGLYAWHEYPISTGQLEGTNNKIKTMKRQAYGFRDHEFFKLKIKALHQTRYELVG